MYRITDTNFNRFYVLPLMHRVQQQLTPTTTHFSLKKRSGVLAIQVVPRNDKGKLNEHAPVNGKSGNISLRLRLICLFRPCECTERLGYHSTPTAIQLLRRCGTGREKYACGYDGDSNCR